jgi:exodeoxyribonuclease VII small subunit
MTKKEDFTYEIARKKLEQIIAGIDAGKIGIDDLDDTLKEAKMLIEKAMEKLAAAEKIVVEWEK